jgi:hypothetical protein
MIDEMGRDTETSACAVIDEAITRLHGRSVVGASEVVDLLLDLRLQVADGFDAFFDRVTVDA